ncbi:MAG: hypothetical protein ACYDEB_02475 [Dehalococcoidia bacterium]
MKKHGARGRPRDRDGDVRRRERLGADNDQLAGAKGDLAKGPARRLADCAGHLRLTHLFAMAELFRWLITAVGAAAVYAFLRFVYSHAHLLPFNDADQIIWRLRSSGGFNVGSTSSERNLVVWCFDERMLSFDFCLGEKKGEMPRLIVFETTSGLVPDLIDAFFRLDHKVHYRKVFEVTFASPGSDPIFVVDDVRFVDETRSVLSVVLSGYNCGSGGAKYLGLFKVCGREVAFFGPGPLKAFRLNRPDHQMVVLAPGDRVLADVASGMMFARYSIEDVIHFTDFDGDGREELVNAFMLWGADECHWCPHRWIVSVNVWTPSGFRTSVKICDGKSLVSRRRYAPQQINGFLPGSVGLFGLVQPANLLRSNRDIRLVDDIIHSICSEAGAFDTWEEYFAQPRRTDGFVEVPPEIFKPEIWPTELAGNVEQNLAPRP